MNKAPWVLLVPLCILFTSHQAHSEKHSYPATPGMDLEGCKDSCKKSQHRDTKKNPLNKSSEKI